VRCTLKPFAILVLEGDAEANRVGFSPSAYPSSGTTRRFNVYVIADYTQRGAASLLSSSCS
jgi:hypothetical protein